LHEMSEALWIWHSKAEMAIVGPIVRNEVFFFVVILGAAALVVVREWLAARTPASDSQLNSAERRMRDWEFRRQRRWSLAAAVLCVGVVLAFAAEYVYARSMNAPTQAIMLTATDNQVRIPLSELSDSSLHFYSAEVNAATIRFLVLHKANGDYVAALDACQICGKVGYRQEGQNIVCRNCGAAMNVPSIGLSGGCNPIPLESQVSGGEMIVNLSALADAASTIQP
jgi:high-affinity iron transporter